MSIELSELLPVSIPDIPDIPPELLAVAVGIDMVIDIDIDIEPDIELDDIELISIVIPARKLSIPFSDLKLNLHC